MRFVFLKIQKKKKKMSGRMSRKIWPWPMLPPVTNVCIMNFGWNWIETVREVVCWNFCALGVLCLTKTKNIRENLKIQEGQGFWLPACPFARWNQHSFMDNGNDAGEVTYNVP